MFQVLNDDGSRWFQGMAWCHQVKSHDLNWCWPQVPWPLMTSPGSKSWTDHVTGFQVTWRYDRRKLHFPEMQESSIHNGLKHWPGQTEITWNKILINDIRGADDVSLKLNLVCPVIALIKVIIIVLFQSNTALSHRDHWSLTHAPSTWVSARLWYLQC